MNEWKPNGLEKKNGPTVLPYEWKRQKDTFLTTKNILIKEEKQKHVTVPLDHLTTINRTLSNNE
jgi:hypothetical protein